MEWHHPMRALRVMIRNKARHLFGKSEPLKRVAKRLDQQLGTALHVAAAAVPALIQPRPLRLTVAITAQCNLRCIGCRYGRDFMRGSQLPLGVVLTLIEDAKAAGVELLRLYGGEPLIHPDLPAMVRHAARIKLSTYVTTNGILLEQKIDELFEAGLRNISIGYYGEGSTYDRYVQRRGRYARLERGLEAVRRRYGNQVAIQLNFLIMRPSCNSQALTAAWKLAERYDLTFNTDLIHYSLPYFTEGVDRELQFREADRPQIVDLVSELMHLKRSHPHRVRESLASIASIPDWLLKGPAMRVPCTAYELIWVGADGSVQLCYVTFKLGNLHQTRLRDMLFRDSHREACQNAFRLNCPNCHCERDSRVQRDIPSRLRYSGIQGIDPIRSRSKRGPTHGEVSMPARRPGLDA